jgi:hypothetical protein
MNLRRIVLNIDRVTIEGTYPPRAVLSAAIARELERLLGARGAADELRPAGTVARLDGGRIAPERPGADSLGAAVARATIGALRR